MRRGWSSKDDGEIVKGATGAGVRTLIELTRVLVSQRLDLSRRVLLAPLAAAGDRNASRRLPNARGSSSDQLRRGPAAIGTGDRALDPPRSDVLDRRAAHLKRLAADPSGRARREVAAELGDVHRVGRIEVVLRRSRAGARCAPCANRCAASRVAAEGMIALAVTRTGAISVAIASVNATMPALAAT